MEKSLNQLLEEVYGIGSTYNINPVTDTVATANVTKVCHGNPNRLGLVICNLGVNNIFLAPDNDVSSTKGLLIAASGGKMVLKWDVDFDLTANAWYGIADSADCAIYVIEITSV